MLTASPDPTALVVALSVHMQAEVQLVAVFPGKLCGDVGWPVGRWFFGDERRVLTALVASFWPCDSGSLLVEGGSEQAEGASDQAEEASDETDEAGPADVRSMLQVCTQVEADSASVVKAALYKRFGKPLVRALLRSELKETTVKRGGKYDKAIKDELKNCLRLRR